jgi:type I restriction-modification system DNA methylase subunit
VFEQRRREIIAEQIEKGRSPEEAELRAESKAFYSFTRTVGKSRLPDKKLQELIKHFNTHRLRNDDVEFPDLLGAAYEYLVGEFADSAGKKGGEFYTPRAVVRMLVRLIEPQEGMRVYDPCSGSGGMLILSAESVQEHGGNPRNLGLFGQEDNGGVWSISKMNLLLHGIGDADLRNGDTLAEPLHTKDGELMRFDRVITNPPFSLNYSQDELPFKERFPYGFCPESGKKADLMFVQHMVAVLRPGGIVATVMPHGVLFRGGAERDIRRGLIEDRHPRCGDRPRAEPLLRNRHPRLRAGAPLQGQQAAGTAGQGVVHQRRRGVPRGSGPELLGARAHREGHQRLQELRDH